MSGICYGCFKSKGEYDVCMHCGYISGTGNEPAYMLQPGMYLNDRYIIGTILGMGGFGVTYKAWDTRLNIIVAIKEFFPQSLASRASGDTRLFLFTGDKMDSFLSQKDRFMEEGKHLAKFASDPHVVHVLGTFSENDTAYMVMEYLDGVSLKDYLKQRGGCLPIEEANKIMVGVLKGLHSIHTRGIIHRDISPDNIHILPNGQIKILDFGAARLEQEDKWTENIVVKKGYAPPEQYRTNMEQGYYTDIYASGATWYKLITGLTPEESVDRWEEDILVTPSQVLQVEDGLDSIDYVIMKSLSLQPEDRYETTQMMLDALENHEVGESPKEESSKNIAPKVLVIALLILIASALINVGIRSQVSVQESNETEVAMESDTQSESEIQNESDTQSESDTQVSVIEEYINTSRGIDEMAIEPGEISLLVWQDSNATGVYDDLIEAFEEAYPEYTVEMIQVSSDYSEDDLSLTELPTISRLLIDGFECADLTPVVDSLDLDNYYILEQEIDNSMLDENGNIYFVPTGIQPYAWYADTKTAASLGITLPEEGTSLNIVWDSIEDSLNGASLSMNGLMSLLQIYYPDAYDAESGITDLALWEDDLRKYAEWTYDNTAYEVYNQGASLDSLPAVIKYGGVSNSIIVEQREEYDGYLELIPIVYEGQLQVELYRGMYVNENADENEQLIAMLFIAFMLSEEGQEILNISASSGTIPILKSSVEAYMNVYPDMQVFESYLDNELGAYPTDAPSELYSAWTSLLNTASFNDFNGASGLADIAMETFYDANK